MDVSVKVGTPYHTLHTCYCKFVKLSFDIGIIPPTSDLETRLTEVIGIVQGHTAGKKPCWV